MNDVVIRESKIWQFKNGKGVYANRNFKKGDIVIKYNLKPLTKEEFDRLTKEERKFTHRHKGVINLYSIYKPLLQWYVFSSIFSLRTLIINFNQTQKKIINAEGFYSNFDRTKYVPPVVCA